MDLFNSDQLKQLQNQLEQNQYFADLDLIISIFLSNNLERPLFIEGEPGVGKTEIAKVMANVLNAELIRVQCYPGMESDEILYEWNYLKQILSLRMKEDQLNEANKKIHYMDLFSKEFLIARPLMKAITQEKPVVLLIDEIDRADERFEAYLLEYLSDFQISVPELGTIKALNTPYVTITSNSTRDIHDALKRRCIYQWIDFPSYEKEKSIVLSKTNDLSAKMAEQICVFMSVIRQYPFEKKPGLSETLDWAEVVTQLEINELFHKDIAKTFGCLFKSKEDVSLAENLLEQMFGESKSFLSRLS
ncbi:MoxR family ATPase [Salicibibacter cibarius]|uniref:MoxR family ATPase n=1 Tax=Salicibibacter cibarius TaxID=2743000 RepID=A0A7T6Z0R3_9BACI|nr:MoxR family ATPase [Salicibibacter cibarius]QQK74722.1 MoxR family ATPase [Salicibibacter cibarius]